MPVPQLENATALVTEYAHHQADNTLMTYGLEAPGPHTLLLKAVLQVPPTQPDHCTMRAPMQCARSSCTRAWLHVHVALAPVPGCIFQLLQPYRRTPVLTSRNLHDSAGARGTGAAAGTGARHGCQLHGGGH